MISDILTIFITTINAYKVQVSKLTKPYANLSDLDFGFRNQLYHEFNYHEFFVFHEVETCSNTLFHFEDDFDLKYAIFSLPSELSSSRDCQLCCIGPFLYSPISMQRFQDIAKEMNLPIEYYKDLQEFFNQIPIISNLGTWETLFTFFLSQIFSNKVPYMEVQLSLPFKKIKKDRPSYVLNPSSTASLSLLTKRYEIESLFLNAVTKGDLQKALQYHNDFLKFQLNSRVADPVRNRKNLCLTQNTLLRKAVEFACVHPYHIDALSSQFAIQIENCSNTNQIRVLSTTIIKKYCLLVQQYSRKNYSSIIQKCLDYIDLHYEESISLNFLAKQNAVTNVYLSALFKKEVGLTLTNYLNKTRIKHAIYLLNTTDLSIQTIAEVCGFNDANYFARTFKKYKGISAKSYRDSLI